MANGRGGKRAGAGRKKGIPNKLTMALKEMILEALAAEGGIDYLRKQAKDNPVAFMGLLSRILPMQVTGEGGGPVLIATGVPRASADD